MRAERGDVGSGLVGLHRKGELLREFAHSRNWLILGGAVCPIQGPPSASKMSKYPNTGVKDMVNTPLQSEAFLFCVLIRLQQASGLAPSVGLPGTPGAFRYPPC